MIKMAARSAMFIAASAFFAADIAFATAGPKPTPMPIAGAGFLALGVALYVARVIRRMR